MNPPTALGAILVRAAPRARAYSSFRTRPAPPALPASQQAEFERLQRDAAVSSAFRPDNDDGSGAADPASARAQSQAQANTPAEKEGVNPALRRGAPPEFDGDKNPTTGEVGGPKNEPLRWGGRGDWSYNGRVTDF
ncbi:FMP21-like protein [Metarhizium album ARSEF 1941]|uniref:Succinate dehydrogenase assembly factor 4, mitochondrial n=1 Tax=Metarhizium album (strain ARSEF 1941) TaxID=1081103 RepID=A0A0B2WT67_METAS|nr:FMP21-like protein [Metarhizium album ARSEF 1941]KHN96692.1 FMP21-like protein [Metarhizium album ARSEF 1941]